MTSTWSVESSFQESTSWLWLCWTAERRWQTWAASCASGVGKLWCFLVWRTSPSRSCPHPAEANFGGQHAGATMDWLLSSERWEKRCAYLEIRPRHTVWSCKEPKTRQTEASEPTRHQDSNLTKSDSQSPPSQIGFEHPPERYRILPYICKRETRHQQTSDCEEEILHIKISIIHSFFKLDLKFN